MNPAEDAWIALGSNLGDREQALHAALENLGKYPGIRVVQISPFLETEPVGGPAGQSRYINAVARLSTTLTPEALLEVLLKVERLARRVRDPHERNAPRTLDLDILFFGNRVIDTSALKVPHPRLHERRFVLEPLNAIAPGLLHPVLKKTVREMCAAL